MDDNTKEINNIDEQIKKISNEEKQEEIDESIKITDIQEVINREDEEDTSLEDTKRLDRIEEINEEEVDSEEDTKKITKVEEVTEPTEEEIVEIEEEAEEEEITDKENYKLFYIIIFILVIIECVLLYFLFK